MQSNVLPPFELVKLPHAHTVNKQVIFQVNLQEKKEKNHVINNHKRDNIFMSQAQQVVCMRSNNSFHTNQHTRKKHATLTLPVNSISLSTWLSVWPKFVE